MHKTPSPLAVTKEVAASDPKHSVSGEKYPRVPSLGQVIVGDRGVSGAPQRCFHSSLHEASVGAWPPGCKQIQLSFRNLSGFSKRTWKGKCTPEAWRIAGYSFAKTSAINIWIGVKSGLQTQIRTILYSREAHEGRDLSDSMWYGTMQILTLRAF